MPDLSVWPTDGADGSVSSEARWRKMGRLWVPSGVDGSPLAVGPFTPTLAAGPVINVTVGAAWLDGHYAELTTPASIPVTANGLLVLRFTPADNRCELLYRDGASLPTQTLPTWELPIAQMIAGSMFDKRSFADPQTAGVGYVEKTATGALVCTATSTLVPGTSAPLGTGRWEVTALFDIQIQAADAANTMTCVVDVWPPGNPGIVRLGQFWPTLRGFPAAFTRTMVVGSATFDVKALPNQVGLFGSATATSNFVIQSGSRWTATRIGPAAP